MDRSAHQDRPPPSRSEFDHDYSFYDHPSAGHFAQGHGDDPARRDHAVASGVGRAVAGAPTQTSSASTDPPMRLEQHATTASQGKRSADHFDDSRYSPEADDEPDIKDEEAGGSGSGGQTGGGGAEATGSGGANSAHARKNRATAAPPLKRGSACMLCRKRKLRCDGLRPKCGTCLRLSHECIYGDPATEKMQERTRELEDRIRKSGFVATRGSTFGGLVQAGTTSSSVEGSERAGHERNGSYAALNMLSADPSAGYPSPLLAQNASGPYPGYPSQPFPSQQQQQLDSPYLSFPPSGDPPRMHPHSPQAHLQGQQQQDPYGRPESEAFPLPPRGGNNGFLSRLPIPGDAAGTQSVSPGGLGGADTSSPVGPQAHLQSFPFPMNPTPQLADLINPQQYSPVGGVNLSPNASYSTPHQGFGNGANDAASSPVALSSQHHLSPSGYPSAPSSTANGPVSNTEGYAGLSLSSSGVRQPFDNQSALASPDRNVLSLGGGGTLGGIDDDALKKPKGEYGEVQTTWGGADLPDIDLMMELANIYFSTIHQHLPFLHRPRFLYTLRHPASLSSPPSLSLIFAVLAVAAAYHDSPTIRGLQNRWYTSARDKVEAAIQAGIKPAGGRVASLTVEMVQALCLLALLEMGQSDHQRAFLSIGQAVRIAAMLGLHRMDEDRLSERCGTSGDKRLRPPALHELPRDGVLLEECRRTMCAVFVLDRFEQGCVGWPSAISEADLRILLPCNEAAYENGICTSDDNPLWWPVGGLEVEDQEASKPGNEARRVGTFAWLCRAAWVGGRIQLETYRPSGPPAGGPWNKNVAMDPLFSASDMIEMDKLLDFVRSKLGQMAAMKASQHKGVDGPVIMILLLVNCLFVNLHHLRAATGLSQLPFDPTAPIFVGTAEYSMQRCWEAIHSLYEIVSQLAGYENAHTSLHRAKVNTFTSFVPYTLYCIAFPAKFAIGDWTALVNSRDRIENVPAHLSLSEIPRGDDVFPPSYFDQRLKMVDALCDAMERCGAVWPIGLRFASMVAGDRIRLAERTFERQHHHSTTTNSTPGGPSNRTQQQTPNMSQPPPQPMHPSQARPPPQHRHSSSSHLQQQQHPHQQQHGTTLRYQHDVNRSPPLDNNNGY
ncbi:hypothetical protein JCM10212_001073 [Sporobolomyces blumeae]